MTILDKIIAFKKKEIAGTVSGQNQTLLELRHEPKRARDQRDRDHLEPSDDRQSAMHVKAKRARRKKRVKNEVASIVAQVD